VLLFLAEAGSRGDPRLQGLSVRQQVLLILQQSLELLPLLFFAAEEVGPQFFFGNDPEQKIRRLPQVRTGDIVVIEGGDVEVERSAGRNLERLQIEHVIKSEFRLLQQLLGRRK